MAPAALTDSVSQHRDGLALEQTSDAIDAVHTAGAKKEKSQFRQYHTASPSIRAFYHEQHTKQTVAYNLRARNLFHSTIRAEMSIWDAMEKLNKLIDDSDPDTSLSQIEHLLQSAEAIRRDGRPRWMQCVGLIHDLGKLLYFYGAQGQWDVVGDTFPVGVRFSEANVLGRESFKDNDDFGHGIYDSEEGIYVKGGGLGQLMLSWGHDEYLYEVVRGQSTLPEEGLALIRYHSFYPWHTAGAYREFMNEKDKKLLDAVKAFNPYDLYSKSDEVASVEELKPYYLELIDEFFPEKIIKW